MSATEDLIKQGAQAMVRKKEEAILAAIDHHYGKGLWTEELASREIALTADNFGTETLSINGVPMLIFFPVSTDTIISVTNVICTFEQGFKVLYD